MLLYFLNLFLLFGVGCSVKSRVRRAAIKVNFPTELYKEAEPPLGGQVVKVSAFVGPNAPKLTATQRSVLMDMEDQVGHCLNNVVVFISSVEQGTDLRTRNYFGILENVLQAVCIQLLLKGIVCFSSAEATRKGEIAFGIFLKRFFSQIEFLSNFLRDEDPVSTNPFDVLPASLAKGGRLTVIIFRKIMLELTRLLSIGIVLNNGPVFEGYWRRQAGEHSERKIEELLQVLREARSGASIVKLLQMTNSLPEAARPPSEIMTSIMLLPRPASPSDLRSVADDIARLGLHLADHSLASDLLIEILKHLPTPENLEPEELARLGMRMPLSMRVSNLVIETPTAVREVFKSYVPALQLTLRNLGDLRGRKLNLKDDTLRLLEKLLLNLPKIAALNDQQFALLQKNVNLMRRISDEMKMIEAQETATGPEQVIEGGWILPAVTINSAGTSENLKELSCSFLGYLRQLEKEDLVASQTVACANQGGSHFYSFSSEGAVDSRGETSSSLFHSISQGSVSSGEEAFTFPEAMVMAEDADDALTSLYSGEISFSGQNCYDMALALEEMVPSLRLDFLIDHREIVNTFQGLLEASVEITRLLSTEKPETPTGLHLDFLRSALVIAQSLSESCGSSEEIEGMLHWYEKPAADAVSATENLSNLLARAEKGSSRLLWLTSKQWVLTLLLDPLLPKEAIFGAIRVEYTLGMLAIPIGAALTMPSEDLKKIVHCVSQALISSRVGLCLSVHDGISREFFGGVLDSRPFPSGQAPQKQKKAKGSKQATNASARKAEISRALSAHSPEQVLRLQQRLSLFLKTLSVLDLQCGLVSRALDLDGEGEGEGLLQRFARSLEGPGEDLGQAAYIANTVANRLKALQHPIDNSCFRG